MGLISCPECIVRHPILRADGSILQAEGYDGATGLYLDMGGEPLALDVPERPAAADVKRAVDALSEVLADFPFVDGGHRANALALFLTVPLRELIDGPVPLFAIDAPEAGSGKGLLMRTACVLARGSVPEEIRITVIGRACRRF